MNRVHKNYNNYFIKNYTKLNFLDFKNRKVSEIFNFFTVYSGRIVDSVIDLYDNSFWLNTYNYSLNALMIFNSLNFIILFFFIINYSTCLSNSKKNYLYFWKIQLKTEQKKAFYVYYFFYFFKSLKLI